MASLHRLARRGDPFELLATLEARANPNEAYGPEGRTPLMIAAKADNRIAVRLLLGFGADPNVTSAGGSTALLEASGFEVRRILLDAGAKPDLGRIAGMTLAAFFASFRERSMVDFLLSYGADPSERTREGQTIRELLDGPADAWRSPEVPDTPERRKNRALSILKSSEGFRKTPERYVAEHRDILQWSLHTHSFDDPALADWARRVFELVRSVDLLEAAYRLHLAGEELDQALHSLERRRRDAEFAAAYFSERVSSVSDLDEVETTFRARDGEASEAG